MNIKAHFAGCHITGRPQAQHNVQEQDAEDCWHKKSGVGASNRMVEKTLSNDDSYFVALVTETTVF